VPQAQLVGQALQVQLVQRSQLVLLVLMMPLSPQLLQVLLARLVLLERIGMRKEWMDFR
jgi:hypothetical protein